MHVISYVLYAVRRYSAGKPVHALAMCVLRDVAQVRNHVDSLSAVADAAAGRSGDYRVGSIR